jgi:hypothetical protein
MLLLVELRDMKQIQILSHPIGYPTLVGIISNLVNNKSNIACQLISLLTDQGQSNSFAKIKAQLELFLYLGRGDLQLLGSTDTSRTMDANLSHMVTGR